MLQEDLPQGKIEFEIDILSNINPILIPPYKIDPDEVK